jgi:hypothetical protein
MYIFRPCASHSGHASAAQYLDGTRLTGETANPRSLVSTLALIGAQEPTECRFPRSAGPRLVTDIGTDPSRQSKTGGVRFGSKADMTAHSF